MISILNVNFTPYPFLLGLVVLGIWLVVQYRHKRKLAYLFCSALFWVYILFALDVIFFPIRLSEDWPSSVTLQTTLTILSHINLIPFYFGNLFSASTGVIFYELVGNILLTLPFGFGLPLLVQVPARRILAIALAAGLALETTQLALPLLGLVSGYGHSVDINDVILNAVGVLIGYGLLRGLTWLYRGITHQFSPPDGPRAIHS